MNRSVLGSSDLQKSELRSAHAHAQCNDVVAVVPSYFYSDNFIHG